MSEATPQLLRPVSFEERRVFYKNEWNVYQIPKFILRTFREREWGFDHTGDGPSDRKNHYTDLRDLQDFIKSSAPFAIYTSTAFYERPGDMEGWLGAELVFDIDAKDLPLKRCNHEPGSVCPICLEDAKEVALGLVEILRQDLGFKRIHIVYSGRGYHVRVLDNWVLSVDSRARQEILDYVLGTLESLDGPIPFSVWRVIVRWLHFYLVRVPNSRLKMIGITKGFKRLRESAQTIVSFLEMGERPIGLSPEKVRALVEDSIDVSRFLVDRRVTVDVKRLIRLPSSLHSKVGLRVTYIGMSAKALKQFNPFVHAVPKFRKAEVVEAYEIWLEKMEDGGRNG